MNQRKANRLTNYAYSQAGYYFVTICTKDRVNYFGEIENQTMQSNNIGFIAKQCWQAIPEHFWNTELDEFIIMPNHVHGIVDIHHQPVGNNHGCSLPMRQPRNMELLPKIISQYKSSVTRIIRKTRDAPFAWQKSFYDRIIRNEEELHRIREYIQNNPLKWDLDTNNPKNWMR